MPLKQLAPEHIRAIAPYQPGKPIGELAREMGLDPTRIVKLASNENPLGLGPKARAAIAEELDQLARYPDGNGFELKTAIAARFGVALDQIVLGNGSNDILELIARTFLIQGDSSIYSQYAFAVYPLAIQGSGARAIEVPAKQFGHDLPAMRAAIEANTKVLWVANPNNPTGTIVPADEMEKFLAQCPANVLVVLDEAYTEYLEAAARPDTLGWLKKYPNLIVVRTLSKAYGLAGLRIGFALTSAPVADLINRVRQPFNVNSLAQAAACAALEDDSFLQESVRINHEGMQQITQAFLRLSIEWIPSHGNFITFRCQDAARLNRFMLEQGVIIRPLNGYGLPDFLRVSIGLPHENARFIEVLEQAAQAGIR